MVILTRQAAIPLLRAVLAVPATRSVRGIPTEVAVGPEDGLPTGSVLSLDNLSHVQKHQLIEPICTLSAARMCEVCRALAIATGCD